MLLFNFQNLIAQQFVNSLNAQPINVTGKVPQVAIGIDSGQQDPNTGQEEYEDRDNNNLVYTTNCNPIVVTNLIETNSCVTILNVLIICG
jgi:hypothetical protein